MIADYILRAVLRTNYEHFEFFISHLMPPYVIRPLVRAYITDWREVMNETQLVSLVTYNLDEKRPRGSSYNKDTRITFLRIILSCLGLAA